MPYKPEYFTIEELVCKHVHDVFGEKAWMFLDDKALEVLDWIRKSLHKPITVNTWAKGGSYSQRGLRCNICPIVQAHHNVLYMSAHCLGRAFDFDVEGYTAKEVRAWLVENKDLVPHNIRLEGGVPWIHLDTYAKEKEVYIFKKRKFTHFKNDTDKS